MLMSYFMNCMVHPSIKHPSAYGWCNRTQTLCIHRPDFHKTPNFLLIYFINLAWVDLFVAIRVVILDKYPTSFLHVKWKM